MMSGWRKKQIMMTQPAVPHVHEQEPVAQSRPFTKKQRDTLCTVYAIASASTTANSLPNIAKIVNELLTEDLEVQPKEPEQEKNLLKRVISWMEKVSDSTPENTDDEGIALVKDIYKALAQPSGSVEQEPVAKVCHDLDGHIGWNPKLTQLPDEGTLLYTTPPQRPSRSDMTWVGLDADEVFELASGRWTLGQMAVLVEAKLKEKNTNA